MTNTIQKLPWHAPKITDLGIHVSDKKNTWPNFFPTISKIIASHGTLPIVYPEVKIIETRILEQRFKGRVRISPQARAPNNPGTKQPQPLSHYDKMRMDNDGD